MTGDELKQLRHDLGDSIGRRLSTADMAKLCGLVPKNGADTFRKWEAGQGPSGPVAALLSILAYADNNRQIPSITDIQFELRKVSNGETVDIGPAVTVPIIREMMRAEILRRLS